MATTVLQRAKSSLRDLIVKANAAFEYHNFRANDGKTHVFFVCGQTTGYISPAAKEKLEKASDDSVLDDLKFAECSIDGGATWVPTVMVVGNGHVANKTFGASLLRG